MEMKKDPTEKTLDLFIFGVLSGKCLLASWHQEQCASWNGQAITSPIPSSTLTLKLLKLKENCMVRRSQSRHFHDWKYQLWQASSPAFFRTLVGGVWTLDILHCAGVKNILFDVAEHWWSEVWMLLGDSRNKVLGSQGPQECEVQVGAIQFLNGATAFTPEIKQK